MDHVWNSLAQAAAIAIIATALAFISRATGVFILEAAVFGTASALALAGAVSRQSPAAPQLSWFLLSALLSLGLSVALINFYRHCRRARGGDSTALMMSFALMNTLALTITSVTDGKSVNIDSEAFGSPLRVAIVGWAVMGLICVLMRGRRFLAMIKLARDNDSLLSTFGISASIVRLIVTLTSCSLLALGVAVYVFRQENFSTSKADVYVIPAFAVAICQSRLKVVLIGSLSIILVFLEQFLESNGQLILGRAYEGALLVALALSSSAADFVGIRLRGYKLTRSRLRIEAHL
jgi:hypothetical protein